MADAQRLGPCTCDVSYTYSIVKVGLNCVYLEERVHRVIHPREVEGRLGATELVRRAVVRAAQTQMSLLASWRSRRSGHVLDKISCAVLKAS